MRKTLGLTLSLGFMILAIGCSSAATPTAVPTNSVQPSASGAADPAPETSASQPTMAAETSQDIVDLAVADGRFTTLVAAVEAAGLVETLQSDGPFTVFAPTDDAFAQLPEGTVEALLEDIPALTDILLYHVVPGQVPAADVVHLDSADTVLGQPLTISVTDGQVMINDSMVVITDIPASNGLIHVVDTVLMPPMPQAEQMPAGSTAENGRSLVESNRGTE